ncbi:peptidoglycan recognition protein family protein [Streptomyces alkaliterrae]|uniref:N-acetylmuramoyl-L-alanine amidase n=1 Tax=Streptomyces alkaliterrae TaxID=2213162 RepID=A0A5P0YZK6_9ACTN|nr:peptidoglycan recognition protein [Streptomyces alkaliterrae]MBB1256757.1 peptidoglycan recognition protein [Streptomyces alkaliterrae]MBB1262041.1 peptidoglycan recognition protein [Streptomyces alkaliterrae]MQS05132.1 N-acetylmuramoyl-L-alanine amidase [Streptomyces alkaliterrae]
MRFQRVAPATGVLLVAVLTMGDTPPATGPRPDAVQERRVTWAAPRPAIVPRAAWRADEELVREPSGYNRAVRAVVVHHTGHGNNYRCADVPEILRAMQRDHVRRMGWDDLGYNFVVDRCGTVYEGRAGGVDRAVRGAHSKGFNTESVGIAVIGTFGGSADVPRRALAALAAVAAWKLAPHVDPRGTVRLVSTNNESRFPEGTAVRLSVISGHRDSFPTHCPGDAFAARLPELRRAVADLRAR